MSTNDVIFVDFHIFFAIPELITYEMDDTRKMGITSKREILLLTEDPYLLMKICNVKHYMTIISSDSIFRCIYKDFGIECSSAL